MLMLPLTPLLKYIVALIISLLIAINGYKWDENHQKFLQAKNNQKITYILKHPEEIKGCKL